MTVGFVGHKYSDQVCKWVSCAIEREVYLMRAPSGHTSLARLNKLPLKHQGDVVKTYTAEAPIHLINDDSVRKLRKTALKAHKNQMPGDFCVDYRQFRGNILIDEDETKSPAFVEEYLREMRLGPLLMRCSGPSVRCNSLPINPFTGEAVYENEPYQTLSKKRTVPGLGVIFGTYYQCELLTEEKDFLKAMPCELGYESYS